MELTASSRRRPIGARSVYAVMTLLLALLLAGPAGAQDSTVTDDDVNRIARQLYCPVCENIPLDVCPTLACEQWRGEIRLQLEAGRSDDQIIADFVARYGDRVVGTPQDPLLRALSLLTPLIFAIAALGMARALFRRWRRQQGAVVNHIVVTDGEAASLTDDDYRARLERDLQARR